MDNDAQRYDRRTIALHWLTAALVLVLWILGQTIDEFPKGTLRIFARSTHITLGTLLVFVLLARLRWRLGSGGGTRLPPAGAGWLDTLARLVHGALYLLLAAALLLGLANTWVRGDNLFGLFSIPSFAPGDKPLREAVEDAHELAANTLFMLAALHAGAGLLHHFVMRDQVLLRMMPRRGRNAAH